MPPDLFNAGIRNSKNPTRISVGERLINAPLCGWREWPQCGLQPQRRSLLPKNCKGPVSTPPPMVPPWPDPYTGGAERAISLATGFLTGESTWNPPQGARRLKPLNYNVLRKSGVCQTSCPPISCGVSDFRGADFVFGVEPDGSCRLPVAGFA
jgi:hypothetical protein